LREHQDYPVEKDEIVGLCDRIDGLDELDKQWLKDHLSDRIYYSAEDVLKNLSW